MFAGLMILSPSLTPQDVVAADAWLAVLSPFFSADVAGVSHVGSTLLVEASVFNLPRCAGLELPYRCKKTGVVVAFWGRLDNRRALAAEFGPAPLATDADYVLAAWQRWGEGMPEHLLGDFALAVIDPVRQTVFLARDPLGVKPLYYFLDGRLLVFATTVAAFKCVKPLTLTPDVDWMARYLNHLSMSDHETGYREIVKLPPGHCLMLGANGAAQVRRWFHWRDDPPPAGRRNVRWVDEYRMVLEESIRCRMESAYPLGTENSGGIDSATITAYLAHFLGNPGDRLHSFGFAMFEHEASMILETSQAKSIVHNYVVTARNYDDKDAIIARSLAMIGYPEEHGNASGHTPFYRECELRGIRSLFSGFGGDEVVTNPGYLLRRELLDAGQYHLLWDILPGNLLTRSLRLGKTMWDSRRQQYHAGFLQAWHQRWPHQLLRDDVVTRLDMFTAYMETARFDAPYRRINDFILNNRIAAPVSTRLENCTLVAASYGIDYRWPLWDARLVQQYLSTPGIEKMGPKGIGRYLHRRAIDGMVPRRVAWKHGKDMGKPRTRADVLSKNLSSIAEQARRQEAHLHPALESLIDRDKYRAQIERAQKGEGGGDQNFAFSFIRITRALRQLNHWLSDGPVD